MTKLWKALAAVAAVSAGAYLLLVDGIIRAQLERAGTHALQAPLAIGEVTFHLLPTSLTLRDVRVGNPRLSTRNLVQADSLSLPLSLRDLFARKLLIDAVEVRGLRFHRPRAPGQADAVAGTSATGSPQLRAALQRAQQLHNHPLASNTIDAQASISGALLADQFQPLLAQLATALDALARPAGAAGAWQILLRRVNVEGALDFGTSADLDDGALRFTGSIDNVTPQPQRFGVVTHIDLHSAEGEAASLRVAGSLDQRKTTEAALRFDLENFPLTQWTLSHDPELNIVIVNARADVQALLSLTGNQFDLNALLHCREANFAIANGDSEIARAIADVWRRTDAFDIRLQASGAVTSPVLAVNSSLDVPLANALRQLQPAAIAPAAISAPALPPSP